MILYKFASYGYMYNGSICLFISIIRSHIYIIWVRFVNMTYMYIKCS